MHKNTVVIVKILRVGLSLNVLLNCRSLFPYSEGLKKLAPFLNHKWIILGWILERWDGVMWTGLVWLRLGTGGELL
jgi:hypothetical protein